MRARLRLLLLAFTSLLLAVATGACSDGGIDSDEAARRAYLGLDKSIQKSLDLGFAGYNAASSANIPAQLAPGDELGELTISGQVAQGQSSNHEMRLYVGMIEYSDCPCVIVVDEDEEVEVDLTYDTSDVQAEQPYLHLRLRNVPDGTLEGSLTTANSGPYHVRGDIEGRVDLNLTFTGTIRSNGAGGVERVPGSTTVTGTATSGDGVYEVNLTL